MFRLKNIFFHMKIAFLTIFVFLLLIPIVNAGSYSCSGTECDETLQNGIQQYNLAENYYRNGDYTDALASYQAASNLGYRRCECQKQIISCYLKKGVESSALTVAHSAFSSCGTNDVDLWLLYGDALYASNRYQEALDTYKKALEIDPYSSSIQSKVNIVSNALSYNVDNNKLIEKNTDEAITNNNQGYVYYKEKKYSQALYSFNSALNYDPDLTQAWKGKALTLDKLGESAEAINFTAQAITRFPNNELIKETRATILNNYAVLLVNSGRFEDAYPYYQEATNTNPGDDVILKNFGSCYQLNGDYKNAFKYYTLSLLTNPTNNMAKDNRFVVEKKINLEDKIKIDSEIIKKIKTIDLTNPPIWFYEELINYYIKKSDYTNAFQISVLEVEEYPSSDQAWNNIDQILIYGSDSEKLSYLDKMLDSSSSDWIPWVIKGKIYNNEKKFKTAVQCYDNALDVNSYYSGSIVRPLRAEALEKYTSEGESAPISPIHVIGAIFIVTLLMRLSKK